MFFCWVARRRQWPAAGRRRALRLARRWKHVDGDLVQVATGGDAHRLVLEEPEPAACGVLTVEERLW